ncbi:MAG: hypothetical protein ACRD9L_23290 [Bryobacteraceae bacterium]
MQRRSFFRWAAAFAAGARGLPAQIAGKPTNLDEHSGMTMGPRPSNLDAPTRGMMNAPAAGARPARAPRLLAPNAPAPPAVTPVLTRCYDNSRSGANLRETTLTPANVQQKGLRKLFTLEIVDDARGCEGQPLLIPNVTIADGTTHDLAILCSMANTVWAYDAQDGALLWVQRLGNPIPGSREIDAWLINDNWGILSTPVADPDTNTLYSVAWSSPDGSVDKAAHTLHALRLSDGAHARPPLSLEGAVYHPGHGLPAQNFKGSARKQRSGLLMTNVNGHKTVFVTCGTILETSSTARGWVIACDVASNAVTAAWAATARFSGGGIWMGGQGPAADAEGYIYALTGNGSFDGVTEFGECFVKLRYTPPSGNNPGSLAPVDWWSPFSDSGRAGGDQTATHITVDNGGGWDDMDLGSGGVVLLPSLKLVLGAGKDGILYVLDPMKMGKTKPADFANPAANYARLKVPPIWFTYYPGNNIDAAPAKFSDLNFLSANRTHHEHSTPVAFQSANHGMMLFCWGENSNLRAWSIDNTGKASYLACSAETASPQSPVPPGGMPGGMMTLSANGQNNAVLWACVPFQDANRMVSTGVLYAYDATNLGTFADGSGAIRMLWTSPQYTYNKFNVPVVSGGKVYVPTYDGKVDVYGLNA